MRREHASILTDVLNALATCRDSASGPFHITDVAARANLPHDRLRMYVTELVEAGLLTPQWPPAPTSRGRQFLECYYAWQRVQALFGLRVEPAPAATTVRLREAPPPPDWARSVPTQAW